VNIACDNLVNSIFETLKNPSKHIYKKKMVVNQAKLAKLKQLSAKNKTTKVGGKRITKKPTQSATQTTTEKIVDVMKDHNSSLIPRIAEINFFCADGNIIHFESTLIQKPVVIQSESNFITAIPNAKYEYKSITDLVPGIIKQVGIQNTDYLEKATEYLQKKLKQVNLDIDNDKDGIPVIEEGKTF